MLSNLAISVRGPKLWFVRTAWIAIVLLVGVAHPSRLMGQGLQFGTDTVETETEKLDPKNELSDREKDRLSAASQYAYARMLLQRDDPIGALKNFERAYRADTNAAAILRDIVPLASTLGRHAEAARYAIIAAERDPRDSSITRQLAEILVEQGDVERGLTMYEKAAALAKAEGELSAEIVMMHAEMGRLYFLTKKFDEAANSLSVVRDALANMDEVSGSAQAKRKVRRERERLYPLIADAFLQVKRFDDAVAMVQKAHETKANEPVLNFNLARIAAERKDWKKAREHLDAYIASKSAAAGTQPYDLLAKLLEAELGDADKAKAELLDRLAKMQSDDGQNVPLQLSLATKLLEAGKSDDAAKHFAELLAKQPIPAVYRALAKIYREQKDAPKLLELLSKGVEQTQTLELFGPEAEAIAKDSQCFDSLVEEAKKSQPTDERSMHSDLAVALLAVGAEKPAIIEEFYTRTMARPKAAEGKIREMLGVTLLLNDQPALAVKVLKDAIAASPKEKLGPYYFYLAGAHEMAGDNSAALEAAEQCAKADPDSLQFLARPAWVLYRGKKLTEAEQRYRDLITKFDGKFDSEENREQLRQARLILSNICVMQNRMPEAEEWLEQVLDEFPEDAGAFNDLGYLWADQGKNLHRAVAMCERAVQDDPDNGAYRDSLGWAYYRLGRFEDAVKELEKAASLSPDGVIFDHLGDAYLKANQTTKAIEAWEKAVASFTKDEDSEKLKLTRAKLDQNKT